MRCRFFKEVCKNAAEAPQSWFLFATLLSKSVHNPLQQTKFPFALTSFFLIVTGRSSYSMKMKCLLGLFLGLKTTTIIHDILILKKVPPRSAFLFSTLIVSAAFNILKKMLISTLVDTKQPFSEDEVFRHKKKGFANVR